MVSSNTGLPDPDNPAHDLRVSNEDVILVTDDEEESDDQETVTLDDYQPLPMEENFNNGSESSEDEASGGNLTNRPSNCPSLPPITPMEDALFKAVWYDSPTKPVDIEMDSKKVDEVKQVMATITLPPSSIPEWAANIPEEEWKGQLMKRLENLKGDKK
ncbi:hypothetical protein NQ317_003515 [Molorchus minor]|uniref:Male-enhanced antigen 1 n=1 Tax=Molorchus minor TaxID=1323400 RepID=A0ABQ9K462_9CUCU|nr:hypothetical protein NQ317_003515 [Molorchus minor]